MRVPEDNPGDNPAAQEGIHVLLPNTNSSSADRYQEPILIPVTVSNTYKQIDFSTGAGSDVALALIEGGLIRANF